MYSYGNAYATPGYGNAYGPLQAVFGQDVVPAQPSWTDRASAWLNTETMGVQRKWLLAGAGAIGLLIYGSSRGWFGGRRRGRR